MTFESTLYFLTHHSEYIIEWILLLILMLSVTLIARGLFGKKSEDAGTASHTALAGDLHLAAESGKGGPAAGEMQVMLQRILDQTTKLESMPTAAAKGGAPAGPDPRIEAQLQDLKAEVQKRDDELTKLKSKADAKGGGGDVDQLAKRLKELETKLAEYEILEDDIADLSLYKEENVRLRGELDKLKEGASAHGSASPSPAAAAAHAQTPSTGAPAPGSPPAPAASSAAPAAQSGSNAENSGSAGSASALASTSTSASAAAADAAALNEMELALSQTMGTEVEGALAASTAVSRPPEEPIAGSKTVAAEVPGIPNLQSGEDIVAEFAQAVNQQEQAQKSAPGFKIPESGDPMADFESAINIEKQVATGASHPTEPQPTSPPAKPAQNPSRFPIHEGARGNASAGTTTSANANASTNTGGPGPASLSNLQPEETPVAEGDDLFAEFAGDPSADNPPAVAKAPTTPPTTAAAPQPANPAHAAEGSLDTEKMMAEMADLIVMETQFDPGNALNDHIDTDKMAAEATAIASGGRK